MNVVDGAGSSQPVMDAPLTACNFGLLPQIGVRFATNTCPGRDLIKGCAAPAREEVVIDFVPPTTGSYSVRAYNPGTNTIMISTGLINPGCGSVSACSGLLGTNFTAGQHYYFAFEASATACAQIEVLID